MDKRRPLIVAAGIFVGVSAIACILAGWMYFNPPSTWGLPKYDMEQIDSMHEGYRRTTLTHGSMVYVNDYEEAGLEYMAGVHVTENGTVYLAENISSNAWLPASSSFSEWVKMP